MSYFKNLTEIHRYIHQFNGHYPGKLVTLLIQRPDMYRMFV